MNPSIRALVITGASLLLCLLAAPAHADILYVANNKSDTIGRFTSSGVGEVFASEPAFSFPQGIAFDSAGNLYAANAGTGTIAKLTSGGGVSLFGSGFLSGTFGLAFDSVGNLYAANAATNGIVKFTPDGIGSVFADFSSGLLSPRGIAFDSAGNLYAANRGKNTIMKFTPDGVGSVYASSGLNSPQFLAFTDDNGWPLLQPSGTVPEPGTAFFGLALLGIALTRRVRRNA